MRPPDTNDRLPSMRWPALANLFLSAWLAAAPFALGYAGGVLLVSDVASGLTLAVLAGISYRRGWLAARWMMAAVGFWLVMAPLVFWAKPAAAAANGTLTGILVMFFAVLVPEPTAVPTEGRPTGWSYNPSKWSHRAPIIVIGFFGFLVARYMSAFQLGHVNAVWDPFFGNGTERILTSKVARAFPISDAGLGAVAYLMESLSGLLGDTRRWRTMPWMVLLFFLLVVPSGITSVLLVILQPVAVGAWCTLCLITAAATVITVPPALDEMVATGQFLWEEKRKGRSVWRIFWFGDRHTVMHGSPSATRSRGGLAGIDAPWPLVASLAIGLLMIVWPAITDMPKGLANHNHLVGALVVTWAVVATAEVGRPVRFLNILLGLWLAAAPWWVKEAGALAKWGDVAMGLALVPLSLPRGPVRERYGSLQRFII